MAKQARDAMTLELPGFPKPLGRPRLPSVRSGRVRTAEWRQRKETTLQELDKRFAHVRDVELGRYMAWADNFSEEDRLAMWRAYGRRQGWL